MAVRFSIGSQASSPISEAMTASNMNIKIRMYFFLLLVQYATLPHQQHLRFTVRFC